MLSLLRTLSSRYLRRRWSRALLVVASIALGVATLVATRALNTSMSQAARSAVTPMAGQLGDLMITAGSSGVPRSLAAELTKAGVAGVRSVHPLVAGRAALSDLDHAHALLLGVEAEGSETDDEAWKQQVEVKVTNPLALLTGRGVFLHAPLADRLRGSVVRARIAGREQTLMTAGTVTFRDPEMAGTLGDGLLFMRLTDAARVLGHPDLVTRIDLRLAPGSNVDEVRRRVANLVAGRADVRTPESNEQSLSDVMAGVELGFGLGGAIALVVGLFLVYNALSVSVAERRHDIGILRSLGATRLQVATLFTMEAGMLGLVGALLGLPLGVVLANVALTPFQNVLSDIFVVMAASRVRVSTSMLAGSAAAGVVTALLAALVPAWHAAREQPADAVRRAPRPAKMRYYLIHVACCAILIGGGLAAVAFRRELPYRLGTFGGLVVALLGLLLATPLLAAVAAYLFRPVARRWFPIEVRLAADNLSRSPGRTGLVIAALAACVALVTQTAGVTLSSQGVIIDWINHNLAAELYVTSGGGVTASSQNLPMDATFAARLEELPEVLSAVPIRFRQTDYRDKHDRVKIIFLIAVEAAKFHAAHDVKPTPALGLLPRLTEPNTCTVSDNFATLHGVGVGDTIQLLGPRGPVPLRIVGTLEDYSWNRGTVFVDRTLYRQQWGDDLVDVFDVFLKSGADPLAVRKAMIERWSKEQLLFVVTKHQLRDSITAMIKRLYGIGHAQQAVVGMVAALGVVMALLISVLQRRRELGLLRAVGASRAQVLRTVLAEATLMGLIGSLIGLLFGVILQWYAVRVILPDEAGFAFPVRVPWLEAGSVVLLTLVLATLAGLLPAWQAMRLRIADAIAYE